MIRSAWLGLLVVGSTALGVACGDDDTANPGVGGSSNGGSGGGGSSGAAGNGGGGGSAGSAGAGGAAGSAGAGGSAGAAGAAGAAGSGGSGGADAGDAGTGEGDAGAFALSSTGFDSNPGCGPDDAEACDFFPASSTNFAPGTNVSPELAWAGAPAGTQSFAIAYHDLSNVLQNGDTFTHWVMWNIPGATTGLPEGLPEGSNPASPAPAGSQQIAGTFGNTNNGFVGSGACGNVYEFELYALDTATFTPANGGNPDAIQAGLEASDAVLGTTAIRARSGPCN